MIFIALVTQVFLEKESLVSLFQFAPSKRWNIIWVPRGSRAAPGEGAIAPFYWYGTPAQQLQEENYKKSSRITECNQEHKSFSHYRANYKKI